MNKRSFITLLGLAPILSLFGVRFRRKFRIKAVQPFGYYTIEFEYLDKQKVNVGDKLFVQYNGRPKIEFVVTKIEEIS